MNQTGEYCEDPATQAFRFAHRRRYSHLRGWVPQKSGATPTAASAGCYFALTDGFDHCDPRQHLLRRKRRTGVEDDRRYRDLD